MMLFPAALLLLLAQSGSEARCPDLTGVYVQQGEDNRVYTTVQQTKCSAVRTLRTNRRLQQLRDAPLLPLDGRFHRANVWFGSESVSARFRGNVLELVAKNADGTIAWKAALERARDGDLCERFEFIVPSNSWKESGLAGRQIGTDKTAEDAAARRSHNGCDAH
jgi:hypothetical protein